MSYAKPLYVRNYLGGAGETGPTGPGGGGGTPVGAPIDGGVGILLAMGIAYGGKKLYSLRQSKDVVALEND